MTLPSESAIRTKLHSRGEFTSTRALLSATIADPKYLTVEARGRSLKWKVKSEKVAICALFSPLSKTEEIVLDCKHVRLLLLYEFKKQSSAGVAADNICGTVGPVTVSYNTAKVWFRKFNNGDFCLENQPRPGMPVAVNEERLLELVQEDRRAQ
ncbi:unnamed protein product [Heligmosomoides polygyrus]|uniref:HTH_48 domain-containing protein n=1 Tax=Heligmosomoides polygyrus TaxID=6339 RepID=A0A183FNS8_HELPZ|nr:unnamed protein product [Heligmosomoides polygyrus]